MSKKIKYIQAKLIVNPGAGKAVDTSKNIKLVTSYLKKNGYQVDVAYAKPKEKATPIARQASKDGFTHVIAMGGDGTIEAVMRGLVNSKVHLGIVPSGTENNIARSLGIPKDLKEACDLIGDDRIRKMDMGLVKTRKGKKFIFFEMATVGLSAAIYPAANKVASGKLSSIKSAALTFIHQEAKPTIFLTLNDESKIEVESMLVMVSNTPSFGKNFKVAPKASLEDGLLDVSIYPDFNKSELFRYYTDVMNGGYSGDGKVHHYQVKKMKIKTSPKLDVMADGVALGKGTVTIKVLPNALSIISPKKSVQVESVTKGVAAMKAPEPAAQTVGTNHTADSVIKLGE